MSMYFVNININGESILQNPVSISGSQGMSFDTGIIPDNSTIQSVGELMSIQQGIDKINVGKSPPFKVAYYSYAAFMSIMASI